MNSFIPWVGGKGKLLWIINKLMPDRYTRFIDVFGGSGTVTMCRPIQRGCMEVYNDFNGNLTNLFCCVNNHHVESGRDCCIAISPFFCRDLPAYPQVPHLHGNEKPLAQCQDRRFLWGILTSAVLSSLPNGSLP